MNTTLKLFQLDGIMAVPYVTNALLLQIGDGDGELGSYLVAPAATQAEMTLHVDQTAVRAQLAGDVESIRKAFYTEGDPLYTPDDDWNADTIANALTERGWIVCGLYRQEVVV